MRWLAAGALALALQLAAGMAMAAAIATAGQDDGYSGRILDKLAAKWKPPKQLAGSHKLRLVLSLDGDGELLECKVRSPSGLDALDASACAAAKAAAPFGPPPYGMPANVHFSFWTGGLDSRVPVTEEKAGANSFHAERAAENARMANEKAQARAQAAAKSSGKAMPGEGPQATAQGGEKARPAQAGASPKPSAQAPLPKAAPQGAQDLPAPVKAAAPSSAGAATAAQYRTKERYISKITWDLRNAMYVPAQAKPGAYHASVRIECDPNGNITSSSLTEGSGNELVDKYVMQGIERAKKILPPPEGYGRSFDLNFTLVRQAKAKKKAPAPAPAQPAPAPAQGGETS